MKINLFSTQEFQNTSVDKNRYIFIVLDNVFFLTDVISFVSIVSLARDVISLALKSFEMSSAITWVDGKKKHFPKKPVPRSHC
jgi:hypothetical protein